MNFETNPECCCMFGSQSTFHQFLHISLYNYLDDASDLVRVKNIKKLIEEITEILILNFIIEYLFK
jgi:hypothetical protein